MVGRGRVSPYESRVNKREASAGLKYIQKYELA